MADDLRIPLGKDAKLYYGEPGGAAANIIAGAVDVTVVLEKDDAEVTRRVSAGWEDRRESIKRLSITFNLLCVVSAGTEFNVLDVLRKTYMSGTYNAVGAKAGIALHVCNDLVANGGAGPLGDFILTRFERAETLGEGQMYNAEAKMIQTQGRVAVWTNAPA